jgi:hypothetical protein
MCKEMSVILVSKVVDKKRMISKKWRAEEEERHKNLLTKKQQLSNIYRIGPPARRQRQQAIQVRDLRPAVGRQ